MPTTLRSSHINRRACKRYLIERAAKTRNGKFTRVKNTAYERLEAGLIRLMDSLVDEHPSIGKTLT